ncbi:MAG: PIN domain-containing protein [Deltaproteobacteria bacterium]|nr:PIN domain-containing protein [Deltaproteobacteria bacterium]
MRASLEGIKAFTSVITIAEVLPKPVKAADTRLAEMFLDFLSHGRNLILIEISEVIAERGGRLRGKYDWLKTMDAIQIAAAIVAGADAFLTNDKDLKKIKDIKILVLEDYSK